MEWIWAGLAIVGGFLLGMVASKKARTVFEGRRGRQRELAPAAASLTFSLIVVVGLLIALAFVQPDSVSKLRDDTIDYLPRVLSALIVVILGGVAGTIVSTAASESIGRSLGRMGEKIPTIVKGIITAFAVILAHLSWELTPPSSILWWRPWWAVSLLRLRWSLALVAAPSQPKSLAVGRYGDSSGRATVSKAHR